MKKRGRRAEGQGSARASAQESETATEDFDPAEATYLNLTKEEKDALLVSIFGEKDLTHENYVLDNKDRLLALARSSHDISHDDEWALETMEWIAGDRVVGRNSWPKLKLTKEDIEFLVSRRERLSPRPLTAEDISSIVAQQRTDMLQRRVDGKYNNVLTELENLGIYDKNDKHHILQLIIDKTKSVQATAVETPLPKPLYKDRNDNPERPELAGTNVVDWLRHVWGDEMKAGTLTRQKLRELDRGADKAVENWLLKQPLPADIRLPTKRELNDAALASGRLADLLSSPEAKEARRLTVAKHRRLNRE